MYSDFIFAILLGVTSVLVGASPAGPSSAAQAAVTQADSASAAPAAKRSCPALHMIAVRGTGDPQSDHNGLGRRLYRLVDAVTPKIPNSDSFGLVYPASRSPTYADSEHTGTENLLSYIANYLDNACPDAKLALFGYSQGAQVVMDTICGTTEDGGFPTTQPLAMQYAKSISSVAVFGDPSFVLGQQYDRGNDTVPNHGKPGEFGGRDTSVCNARYGGRLESYCDVGDKFCAQGDGPNAIRIHVSYLDRYLQNAKMFVVNKFRE